MNDFDLRAHPEPRNVFAGAHQRACILIRCDNPCHATAGQYCCQHAGACADVESNLKRRQRRFCYEPNVLSANWQRIRATDKQRGQYRSLAQAMNRVRTRAREMAHVAKKGGGGHELFRAQYVELRDEVGLMQEQQEDFVDELSEEQQAATEARVKEMAKDLDELNVWMEAMDEELKQTEPDAKKLEKQARDVEMAAKKWQADSRRLASDLSIE